jgi:hypothetical protein
MVSTCLAKARFTVAIYLNFIWHRAATHHRWKKQQALPLSLSSLSSLGDSVAPQRFSSVSPAVTWKSVPYLENFPPGHPFDLTKTRLQTAAPGTYTGAIDVVKKTLARDGVTGYTSFIRRVIGPRHGLIGLVYRLYRGMVPPLLGVTPIFAVSFWVCLSTNSSLSALSNL